MVWAVKNSVFLLIIALVIIEGSGRLDWLMGWAYIVFMFVFVAVTGAVLYRLDPGLLAERSGPQEGSKRWDLALASLISVWLPLAICVIAALDKRLGWSQEIPPGAQAAGLALAAVGGLVIIWAMTANRYFSAVVRIQEDRGHRVATTGPYRWVRHPGYASMLLYYPGTALALGSLWAFVPVALIIVLMLLRTSLEDETLKKELPGYLDYTKKVKYRLIPGVW